MTAFEIIKQNSVWQKLVGNNQFPTNRTKQDKRGLETHEWLRQRFRMMDMLVALDDHSRACMILYPRDIDHG